MREPDSVMNTLEIVIDIRSEEGRKKNKVVKANKLQVPWGIHDDDDDR